MKDIVFYYRNTEGSETSIEAETGEARHKVLKKES